MGVECPDKKMYNARRLGNTSAQTFSHSFLKILTKGGGENKKLIPIRLKKPVFSFGYCWDLAEACMNEPLGHGQLRKNKPTGVHVQ